MNTLSKVTRFFKRRDVQTGLVLCGMMLVSTGLFGQDLESGAQEASDTFKRVIKIGLTVAGSIGIVVGLIMAAFKFFNKDPHAAWWLISVVAGAVLVTLALSLL